MSVTSFGALIAGACAMVTAFLGQDPVTGLIYLTALLAYICLGTTALVRREFYSLERAPRRWRYYAVWGAALGAGVLIYNSITIWQGSAVPPLTARWTAFAFATAISLLTASMIVRQYMLPLSLAIQAAFRMRQENQAKILKRLTNGDHKLAEEVSQTLDLVLNDDS